MKKVIILLILKLTTVVCFSQEWAPIGAKWYFDGTGGAITCNNGGASYDYYLFESVKDTVINSQPCKKITSAYFPPCQSGFSTLPSEFMYSDSGKVYFYRYDKFNLLYDFTAEEGDTISITDHKFSFGNPDTISRIVIDSVKWMIDIVTLPDSLHSGIDSLKVFFTHPVFIDDGTQILEEGLGYREPVIENIGSTSFFFPQPTNFTDGEDGPLRCYMDSSKLFKPFLHPCDQQTDPNVATSENKNQENTSFSIYPNPSNSTITISAKIISDSKLTVFNAIGEKIYFQEIQKTQNTNSFQIDLSEFSNGIYFIQLTDGESSNVKKLLLQK